MIYYLLSDGKFMDIRGWFGDSPKDIVEFTLLRVGIRTHRLAMTPTCKRYS